MNSRPTIDVHTEIVRLDDGPLMDAMDRSWTEQVDAIAGGRVWSGQQAVDNGLVDKIGGVDDALAMVRQRAGVGGEVEVLHVPELKNFADSLFSSLFDAHARAGGDAATLAPVLARIDRCGELDGLLHDALTSDGATKIYALMPGLRVR